MGQPAGKRRRATYADLEAVPPGQVAELIDGELHVFPRPAPRHARGSSESCPRRSISVKVGREAG